METHRIPRIFLILPLGLLALTVVILTFSRTATQAAPQACSGLFMSEYIEGSSYNKAIEIYNGTGAAVDLSAYALELYANGSATVSQSMTLSGMLADGDVYVIAHPNADAAILAVADATNSAVINFNGDDAVVLRQNGAAVDAIGQVGVDPGSAWSNNGVSTKDMTLRRKPGVSQGDSNPNDPFDPSLEWDGYPQDTFDGLGAHTADCAGGGPTATPSPTPTPTPQPSACDTIPKIQGSGYWSTCLGHRDNIEGCITGVTAKGFYFQDVTGDGDPATSDGIFAYFWSTWDNPDNLQPGQLVRVSGNVTEYYDTTEFAHSGSDPLSVTVIGSCTLPTPVAIAPNTDPNADPMALYEQYEGMRVQMSFSGWVVGATKRFRSRYPAGDPEIAFVDFGSSIPDYDRVFENDYPGYQGISYLSGGLGYDLPDLDFGDDVAATDLTGVLGYQFDKYTLLVDHAPTLSTTDNADVTSNAPDLDPAKIQHDLCNFNVENLFDNIDDGNGDWGDWAPGYPNSGDPAGATEYQNKLDALADVIVNRMKSCMVIGVEEVEGKQQVYDDLAAAVSGKDAAHSWQGVYVESGDGRDISQGFLYRDDVTLLSLTPVSGTPYDGWVSDGVLDFVRTPPDGLFRFHGGTADEIDIHFYAVHFKSKRSSSSCTTDDCTDVREKEAADLRDILGHHQAVGEHAVGGGDFNDTLGSSPIAILDGSSDIVNLFYDLPADERWSYVFSGESEVLDHIYLTQNLRPATPGWSNDFQAIHGNADFPSNERASDHDPVRAIFSRCVTMTPPANAAIAQNAAQNGVDLSWDAVDLSDHYQVWESADPYYTPDPQSDAPLDTTTQTSYTHANSLGDPATNHFYTITAVNPCDAASGVSGRTGEFDFALTPGN